MVNWCVDAVFRIVGHSNLGLADALRIQEKEGKLQHENLLAGVGNTRLVVLALTKEISSDLTPS